MFFEIFPETFSDYVAVSVFLLESDEFPPEHHRGYRCRAGAHERVQDKVSRVRTYLYIRYAYPQRFLGLVFHSFRTHAYRRFDEIVHLVDSLEIPCLGVPLEK